MIDFGGMNWMSIGVATLAGQAVSALWFVVLFAKPWAKAYGVQTPAEHTKSVNPLSYGVGLVCVLLVTLGLSSLHASMEITDLAGSLGLGGFVSLFFCLATMLPGQMFLNRLPVFLIAGGSQVAIIMVSSLVLGLFK